MTEAQMGGFKLFGTMLTSITNEIKLWTGEITAAEAAVSEWQVTHGRFAADMTDARDIAADYGVDLGEVATAIGLAGSGAYAAHPRVKKLADATQDAADAAAEGAETIELMGEKMLAAADPAFNLLKKHEGFVTGEEAQVLLPFITAAQLPMGLIVNAAAVPQTSFVTTGVQRPVQVIPRTKDPVALSPGSELYPCTKR